MQKEGEETMNVGGIVNKLEKNAEIGAIALSVYMRAEEGDVSIGTIIKDAPFELVRTFHSIDQIKWKLWNAPHVSQAITKIGVGVYLASEFGLINKKALGKKLIKGGVIASMVTPGSGPGVNTQDNFARAPLVQYAY